MRGRSLSLRYLFALILWGLCPPTLEAVERTDCWKFFEELVKGHPLFHPDLDMVYHIGARSRLPVPADLSDYWTGKALAIVRSQSNTSPDGLLWMKYKQLGVWIEAPEFYRGLAFYYPAHRPFSDLASRVSKLKQVNFLTSSIYEPGSKGPLRFEYGLKVNSDRGDQSRGFDGVNVEQWLKYLYSRQPDIFDQKFFLSVTTPIYSDYWDRPGLEFSNQP